MFGSQTLEIVIGLAFVYLLFSLVCSTLTEFVAQLLRLRSGTLQKAIDNMLAAGATGDYKPIGDLQKFYTDPLIKSLTQPSLYDKFLHRTWATLVAGIGCVLVALGGLAAPVFAPQAPLVQALAPFPVAWLILLCLGVLWIVASFFKYRLDGPGYIPAHIFAQVFLGSPWRDPIDDQAVLSTLQLRLQNKAAPAADGSSKPDPQVYTDVEQWFDAVMERVSGWYTRKTRNIVLVFAVLVTLLLNIDTFAIAHELLQNAPLRQAVAEKAELFLAQNPAPSATVQAGSPQSDGTTTAAAGSAAADTDAGAAVPITDTQSITATLARLDLLKQGIDGLGVPVGWVVDTTYLTATVPLTPLLALVATPIDVTQSGYAAALEQARRTQRLIPQTGADWARKGAGLAVTMILLSLGAPFWYELLGKLVNMRNAGKPPQSAEGAAAAKTKPG